MDAKVYWQYVKLAEDKLKEQHEQRSRAFREAKDDSAWEGQNRDGLDVYLTSVVNYDKGTTAGTTYIAHRRLGAQRIVEGTHRVATPKEIQDHLERLEQNRRDGEAAYVKRNRQFITQVGAPVAAPATTTIDPNSAAFQEAVRVAVESILGGSKKK